MICDGDTIGVFQVESRAQIQMLPRTRPRKSTIWRSRWRSSAPVRSSAARSNPYVEHRQRERTSFLPVEPEYDHPCLIEVLAETHGVVLYQEQVLQVAMALCRFLTPGRPKVFAGQ